MPPRRRPREENDDLPPIISRGGAAVSSDLPPLASRIDTSYGSAPSTALRNTRRGKVRNLQEIVEDVLNDDDSDDDKDPRRAKRKSPKPKPKPTPKPKPQRKVQPQPEPEPEPEPESEPDSGFGHGQGSHSSSPARDPTPERPLPQNSPRRVPTRIAPGEAAQLPADPLRQLVLPSAAPPRGPHTGSSVRRASSEGPISVQPSKKPPSSLLSAAGGLFPPQSKGSVFARAISEAANPERFAQRRMGSEPPALTPTPDSVRTFGQESSLFGAADIGSTPSKSTSSGDDNLIPTIEEEDLDEDQQGDLIRSPSKRVIRAPRFNPPVPPRSLNQPDRPRAPARSPITMVADQPPPDLQTTHNAVLPPPPEPPSTPIADRLRASRQSSRVLSPAQPPAPPSAVRVSAVSPFVTSPHRLVGGTAVSPSPKRNTSRAAPNIMEEPDVPRRQPLPSLEPVSPSPARFVPVRQAPSVSPGTIRPRPNAHQATFETLSGPANNRVQPPQPSLFNPRTVPRQEPISTVQNHGGGLFNSDMQAKVHLEHEQDQAQSEALRIERKARLEAWPRTYRTLYRWTNAPPPTTPSTPLEDSHYDWDTPARRPPQRPQRPLREANWHTFILFTIADTFVDILGFLFSPEAWVIRAVVGLGLALFLSWTAYSGLASAPALGLGGLQWYGLADISHNLGQFVPLWMSRPSTMFSDEDTKEYLRRQRDHEYEMKHLAAANKLHDVSLSKLNQIVPKIVHMTLDKNGKPVVSQEFYHALRALMKDDTDVLTLDRRSGGYHFISDEHWQAIRDRLKKDSVYQSAASPPKPGTSPAEVENIVQNTFSKSWEKWLRNNDQKVAKILEPAYGTSIPDKIGKDLESRLEKFVKDLYQEKGTKDVIVTREEFIRHLKGEFATHRNEVKAEAQELQKKLEQYVAESVQAAISKAPPAGVSRTEMIQVVDEMIHRAIANAGLEALAQGKIGANWNSELRRQINHFAIGTGAVIDPMHTTPNYKPSFKGMVGSPEWVKSSKRSPFVLPPSVTQERWEDEGECWCGKVVVDKEGQSQGASIAYLLSHEVIPQHVVVEHILPGATLDPDARPKDIEVWAYITEVNVRGRVQDFSASHFPEVGTVKKALPDGFVKIGEFTYESSDALNGVHVHQLSPELKSLEAATDHILLRVVSNHGADHTCIYRARLFGEIRV